MAASMRILIAIATLVAVLSPANAGAVYEIKKEIQADPNNYKIVFNQTVQLPSPENTLGTITGSANVLNATLIPLTVVTLNLCSVLAMHYHPLGSEELYVLEGSVEIGIFSEDGTIVAINLNAGEAAILEQGTVHYVENTYYGQTKFLQMFDHPKAGLVFAAQALLAFPQDQLQSDLIGSIPTGERHPFYTLTSCTYNQPGYVSPPSG